MIFYFQNKLATMEDKYLNYEIEKGLVKFTMKDNFAFFYLPKIEVLLFKNVKIRKKDKNFPSDYDIVVKLYKGKDTRDIRIEIDREDLIREKRIMGLSESLAVKFATKILEPVFKEIRKAYYSKFEKEVKQLQKIFLEFKDMVWQEFQKSNREKGILKRMFLKTMMIHNIFLLDKVQKIMLKIYTLFLETEKEVRRGEVQIKKDLTNILEAEIAKATFLVDL